MKKTVGLKIVIAAVALVSLVQTASASIIGSLAIGSTGTVTVTGTTITWNADSAAKPVGASPWNMDVASSADGIASALTFSGCSSGVLNDPGCLGLGEGVDVASLTIGGATPSPFITFECNTPGVSGCGTAGEPPVHADLTFSITSAGPGSSTAPCTSGLAVGFSCSVFPGSPVLLTRTASGTVASLSVFGDASDGASTNPYSGSFSATITGQTPFQLQQTFNVAGSFSTSSSGTFLVTSTVPEPGPGSTALIGVGLIGLGFVLRRQKKTAI